MELNKTFIDDQLSIEFIRIENDEQGDKGLKLVSYAFSISPSPPLERRKERIEEYKEAFTVLALEKPSNTVRCL